MTTRTIQQWSGIIVGLAILSNCKPEGGRIGSSSQAVLANYSISLIGVTVGARVIPGGALPVAVRAENSGATTWTPSGVRLFFTGDPAWTGATLTLAAQVKPGQIGVFSGNLSAPAQIGLWPLAWQAQSPSGAFGPAITGRTEVTCSDGVFCNGDERQANGRCVGGPPPCDDGDACTLDTCDESGGLCGHVLSGGGCAVCAAKNCNPNCHGALCGDDGCGGSCGPCASGQACAAGVCVVATAPGTCGNPLPITGADANAVLAPGYYVTTADNTNGYDEVLPACDPIPAPERVFKIVVNQVMGIDAQSYGIDTVLSIYSGGCGGPLIGCNDDAAPPGNYGSHVWKMLQPGSYYVVVNGFDIHAVGPFTLAVRLVANCVPQCDGKYCGDDGCNGSCGACATGQICSAASRCVSNPCLPQCGGKQCGSDGCGGSCGTCPDGKACDDPTGACKNVVACNHDRPVCATACATNEYCGTDCACHRVRDPRPDVVVDRARLAKEVVFDTLLVSPSSCTVVENCVGGTGLRKLMRFTVEAVNQGVATLTVPPPKSRPDLFQWSPCHGHYHFNGFASYALLDSGGRPVLLGKKLAYCMEDTERVLSGPSVGCAKAFDCTNQGIQSGWSDIYGNSLDCQWLDITDVPPGSYHLQVSVNPNRAFEEGSFDNNTTTVPVTIP